MRSPVLSVSAAAMLVCVSTIRAQQPPPPQPSRPATGEAALVAKARGIHDRVIALDTHNDINPGNLTQLSLNYVGISSDFDGGGGVDGWNGADETFNVTLELVRRGYTEAQIAKIWSGNLLRMMDEVQQVAKSLRK